MRADSIRTLTRVAAAAGALAAGTPPLQAGPAEPFRTRNLSPLVSIFGAPVWRTQPTGPRIAATAELANHYRFSRRGDDVLILDGETWRNGLEVQLPLGERWFAGLEAAYYQLSGGVLDDVIDGWHSAFGLPDGGRDNRPEGDLLFQIADVGGVFYHLERRARGFGDVQLSFGRTLGADERFLVTGTLKAPTGDEAMLAGSGDADWAVTLLRRGERELAGKPAGGYWGLGLVMPGDAELVDFRQRDLVPIAVVGGGWRLLPRIGFRAQLDVHAPFYGTGLKELGQASAQATLGGWIDVGARSRVEFAVNEDLHVSTSPDVVVHAALHWQWR